MYAEQKGLHISYALRIPGMKGSGISDVSHLSDSLAVTTTRLKGNLPPAQPAQPTYVRDGLGA